MTIDERLLKLVDKMSRARKTNRSAFIRQALEAEIRRERIREDEARHTEGYANRPVAQGEFDAWLNCQTQKRGRACDSAPFLRLAAERVAGELASQVPLTCRSGKVQEIHGSTRVITCSRRLE